MQSGCARQAVLDDITYQRAWARLNDPPTGLDSERCSEGGTSGGGEPRVEVKNTEEAGVDNDAALAPINWRLSSFNLEVGWH